MDMQAGRPSKILLISAQGGAAKEMLAENLPQVDPGWSPDGKQMVFGRYIRQPASLQLLDLNSKQVSIIPGSQGLYSPRWSPDGRYLAALTTAQTKIVIFDFNRKIWSDWVSGHGLRLPYMVARWQISLFRDLDDGYAGILPSPTWTDSCRTRSGLEGFASNFSKGHLEWDYSGRFAALRSRR